jgi:hypothetical protein
MILLPSAVRIFLCTRPTDLRQSFDGLTGLVQECFAQDLLTGHLFLFLNRRRDLVQTPRGRLLSTASGRRSRWRRTPAGATGHAPLGNRPAHGAATQAIPARRLSPEKILRFSEVDLHNMKDRV